MVFPSQDIADRMMELMESSSSSLEEELCSSQEAGARSGLAGPECRRSQLDLSWNHG